MTGILLAQAEQIRLRPQITLTLNSNFVQQPKSAH